MQKLHFKFKKKQAEYMFFNQLLKKSVNSL